MQNHSRKVNSCSGAGKGKVRVGLGNYSKLIQVFAVGMNPFVVHESNGWLNSKPKDWLIFRSCCKTQDVTEVHSTPLSS